MPSVLGRACADNDASYGLPSPDHSNNCRLCSKWCRFSPSKHSLFFFLLLCVHLSLFYIRSVSFASCVGCTNEHGRFKSNKQQNVQRFTAISVGEMYTLYQITQQLYTNSRRTGLSWRHRATTFMQGGTSNVIYVGTHSRSTPHIALKSRPSKATWLQKCVHCPVEKSTRECSWLTSILSAGTSCNIAPDTRGIQAKHITAIIYLV